MGWLLAMALAAAGDGAVRRPLADGAWMNWSLMRVEVMGSARDDKLALDNRPLEQQAIAGVESRVGDVVGRVRVQARTELSDLVTGLPATVLATWTVAEGRYYRDGHVEVMGTVDVLPLLAGWSRGRARTPPPAVGGGATGVVLDARGLALEPTFAPKLRTGDGTVLYDSVLWSDVAFTRAPVVWVADPAHPAAGRAGRDPVFVRVASVSGADLIVSDEDAATLARQLDAGRAWGDGTVVVVVDE